MRRITYGALQFDVADTYARALQQWISDIVEVPQVTQILVMPGIPVDSDQSELFHLAIGPGIAIAFGPAPRTLPDPSGTVEASFELEQWHSQMDDNS